MKTNTHPMDYKRRPYYASLEQLEAFRRYEQAKASLVEIIGNRQYQQFEQNLPMATRLNYEQMVELIDHELDRYECYCTPVKDCQGCRERYAAKEIENVQ